MMNVYDKVWIMCDNKPKEMIVYSKTQTMAHMKGGQTEHYYTLVNSVLGAGVGINSSTLYRIEDIYKTKQELLESL